MRMQSALILSDNNITSTSCRLQRNYRDHPTDQENKLKRQTIL